MLVHELAVLFYPAAVIAVLTSRSIERRRRIAVAMSSVAWLVSIVVYYACAALLHGISDPPGVAKWVTSNQSGVSPSLNPVGGLLLLPRANAELVAGHSFRLFATQASVTEFVIAVGAVVVTLILSVAIGARQLKGSPLSETLRNTVWHMRSISGPTGLVIIVWVGAYLLFLIFWEPWQTYYRAFYVPALALGLGLMLVNYHSVTGAKPSGAAALAVAALALFNLGFYIAPNMRAGANVMVAAAQAARSEWNERTVIFFADRNEADTAFEYFNEATRWKRLSRASLLTLDDEIQRVHNEGGEVWLNRGAVELVGEGGLESYETVHEITVEVPNAPARYVQIQPVQ